MPIRPGDRIEDGGQKLHGPGSSKHADGHQDGDQERDDAYGDVETLLGALGNRLVDAYAASQPVRKDEEYQHRHQPIAGEAVFRKSGTDSAATP